MYMDRQVQVSIGLELKIFNFKKIVYLQSMVFLLLNPESRFCRIPSKSWSSQTKIFDPFSSAYSRIPKQGLHGQHTKWTFMGFCMLFTNLLSFYKILHAVY